MKLSMSRNESWKLICYSMHWRIYEIMWFHRMGEVIIELYWRHAPNTCRNFAELARRCYYNNVKFHRIIRDFMVQGKKKYVLCDVHSFWISYEELKSSCLGGDPTGTGKGGSSIYGKKFNDEIHDELRHTGE